MLPMSDALQFGESGVMNTSDQAKAPWHVLVVDDDEVVHVSTDLALAHVRVEGRPLRLSHAHSARDALVLVEKHPDLAVALVDVVMEAPDAGLRLVQQIRQLPGRMRA